MESSVRFNLSIMQFGAKIIFKKTGKNKKLIIFPICLSTLGQYHELHHHKIQSPCENVLCGNCEETASSANLSIRIHRLGAIL